MYLKTLYLVFFSLFISNIGLAQVDNQDAHTVTINIPEVALLDIEPAASTSITLAPTAPTEEGDPVDFSGATNNSLWLNYSSIIGSTTEATRKVTVKMSGTLPGGVDLKVLAGSYSGSGDGTFGTPAGSAVTLSTSDADLITGIGSCYTGDGANSGNQLTYTLELKADSYEDLDFDETASNITVTYTLTNN